MKFVAISFICVIAVVAASQPVLSGDGERYLDLGIIDSINGAQSTWKAGFNKGHSNLPIPALKRLMGVRGSNTKSLFPTISLPSTGSLPSSFDWRKENPLLDYVRDQGECGSCWAFSAVETLGDRFTIQSNATTAVTLSAQDITSCDEWNNGCEGGAVGSAWNYMKHSGVVEESCYAYEEPTCSPDQQPCLPPFKPTAACRKSCDSGSSLSWKSDKHFAKSAHHVASDFESIAREVMQNGPVQCAFTVYEDFVHYKSGVYKHTSGQALGGHAVSIIGFGTDPQAGNYWLVRNSWTTTWGDGGFFKIADGDCGINDDVVAGPAAV